MKNTGTSHPPNPIKLGWDREIIGGEPLDDFRDPGCFHIGTEVWNRRLKPPVENPDGTEAKEETQDTIRLDPQTC